MKKSKKRRKKNRSAHRHTIDSLGDNEERQLQPDFSPGKGPMSVTSVIVDDDGTTSVSEQPDVDRDLWWQAKGLATQHFEDFYVNQVKRDHGVIVNPASNIDGIYVDPKLNKWMDHCEQWMAERWMIEYEKLINA